MVGFFEVHAHEFVLVEGFGGLGVDAGGGFEQGGPDVFCFVFEDDVEGCLFVVFYSSEGFYGLVVFEDLDGLDFVGFDVVAGDFVLASHHVESFDVEFVDGFALVFDGAVGAYFEAWHFFDYVCYAAVVDVFEVGYGVGQGVAVLGDSLGFDGDFVELDGGFLHLDWGDGGLGGVVGDGEGGVAQEGVFYVCSAGVVVELVVAVGGGDGVVEFFVGFVAEYDVDSSHRAACLVGDLACQGVGGLGGERGDEGEGG